ncbi:MAG: HugZ family protein [Gammaproteobacteria bacterium]|nr:MAG: HugZ family protein [Gammaproteobacteria bacterium]
MSEHRNDEQRAHARLEHLLEHTSLMLATCSGEGQPEASSMPFVLHGDALAIFVSELAPHTANLQQNPRASALIAEDEAECRQPFARQRLHLQCEVGQAGPEQRAALLEAFRNRFGKTVDLLGSLPDFHFFLLRPVSARLVLGFGQAWQVTWPQRSLHRITAERDD